jgi:hypothetical protein
MAKTIIVPPIIAITNIFSNKPTDLLPLERDVEFRARPENSGAEELTLGCWLWGAAGLKLVDGAAEAAHIFFIA